jgi:hypothetical protein
MNEENNNEIANMFWHGELSKLEIICIKSFVKNGFDVKLWSYNNLEVEGAESCDARLILPEEHLTKYKQTHFNSEANDESFSSIAVFSDVFRYNVVHKIGGWWFDCDCFCLKNSKHYKELRKGKKIIVGLQESAIVNVASGVFFSTKEIANKMVDELDILLNQYQNNFPKWGMVGPNFISNFTQKHKLQNGIVGIDKFYAIECDEINFYLDKSLKESAKSIIKNSLLTHIWDAKIKYVIDKNNFPKNSLLEEFYNDSYENLCEVNVTRMNHYDRILSRYLRISEIYSKIDKSVSIEDMINHIRNNDSDSVIIRNLKKIYTHYHNKKKIK